jgi:hypothetical protein
MLLTSPIVELQLNGGVISPFSDEVALVKATLESTR